MWNICLDVKQSSCYLCFMIDFLLLDKRLWNNSVTQVLTIDKVDRMVIKVAWFSLYVSVIHYHRVQNARHILRTNRKFFFFHEKKRKLELTWKTNLLLRKFLHRNENCFCVFSNRSRRSRIADIFSMPKWNSPENCFEWKVSWLLPGCN